MLYIFGRRRIYYYNGRRAKAKEETDNGSRESGHAATFLRKLYWGPLEVASTDHAFSGNTPGQI